MSWVERAPTVTALCGMLLVAPALSPAAEPMARSPGSECVTLEMTDDGAVNVDDVVRLAGCLNGPGGSSSKAECIGSDILRDMHVDLADYAMLTLAFDCNGPEAPFAIPGLAFSAFRDGQGPGSSIHLWQVRERLAAIRRVCHAPWLRTYAATDGLELIPCEATRLGHQVAMGTWIRSNTKATELDNLAAAADAGCVHMAFVGNEELYAAGHGDAMAATLPELIETIQEVRDRLRCAGHADIPVTTAEPFDTLFAPGPQGTLKNGALIDHVDVVVVNIYPFHREASIDAAVETLSGLYQAAVQYVNQRVPGKEVIIGETGWPTAGERRGKAVPSLENAQRYLCEVSAWAEENGVTVFYFSAFDEEWKTPPELEGHWGVWDSAGCAKYVESCSKTAVQP